MKKIFTFLWLSLAAFSFNANSQTTSCNAAFTVQFLNANTVKLNPALIDSPSLHHSWTFGDGTPASILSTPTHAYSLPGTYAAVHTVTRLNPNGGTLCTQSYTASITITAQCNLVVNFSFTPSTSNPLTINFLNQSTPLSPADSITWNFGDNTTSHDVSPAHTYANYGTYNVCLIVKKNFTTPNTSPCIAYICKTVTLTVCNLVVDFSWTAAQTNPLSIAFTNLSIPLATGDSSTWSFGDGTSSTTTNPVHTYTNPGTYTVCLTVKKVVSAGSTPCIRYLCKTVVVTSPCNLIVDFSWAVSPTNPLSVTFTNLSTPLATGDSTIWSFGDGTNAYVVNPTHTYANAGTYTVCLIVKKVVTPGTPPCMRYLCKTVVVTSPCTLTAGFTWHPDSAIAQKIWFTNTSTGMSSSDSIRWSFGDNTISNLVNPDHTYAQPGTYTVCLRIQKRTASGGLSNCISETCQQVVVQPNCNFTPSWTWRLDSANTSNVIFTNTTVVPVTNASAIWFFGDGTSATSWNTSHVYTQPGRYYVCLRIQLSPNCVRYQCDSITVPVPCNFTPSWTSRLNSANTSNVIFTNTTPVSNTSATALWFFGDGSSASGWNASHVYAQPGRYNVCLRVQLSPTCVKYKCDSITVPVPCNFTPSWTWRLDSANTSNVIFTNTTAVPTATATAIWFFGDGTSSTSWNAAHVYTQPGRYNVCLRIQLSTSCIRYKCDSVTVPVPPPPCNNQSNFSFVAASTNSQTFTFVPAYQSTAAVYTWTFGDGTGSHDMIATHHYNSGGTYTACLTVWRSAGCTSTTCKTVTVTAQINCDSIHVSYTYQFDPFIPNKVYFYANANFPILDQTWTITRMVTPAPSPVILHQNDPYYVFPDTGYYNVCLRAVTLGGCVKEYCSVIHIAQAGTNVCTLQVYPNPASSNLYTIITLTQPEMIYLYVYNTLNILVAQTQVQGITGNNTVSVNVSNLISGTYTLKAIYGTHICYATFQKL